MIVNALTHVGILGMKWGKHKPESETVVIAKNRVEEQKKNLQSAYNKQYQESLNGAYAPSRKIQKEVAAANKGYRYSKEDLSSVKILDHFKDKEKSTTQLSMEQKYKQKGMTDDEATVAAYQNIRTKKILAVIGGVAITAVVGYALYKNHDDRVDKIIKAGTKLQNISDDSTKGIRDAFYSSKHGLDNAKYAGLYGSQLKTTSGEAFKKQIEVLSDIKQASHKTATDTLAELIKNDSTFAEQVKKHVTEDNRLGPTYSLKTIMANNSLAQGKVDKSVYEVFNAALVDHSPEMQPLTDKFFNALSSKGYNALKDVNDSKYSGYKALNPIIAFNTTGKVNVISVKKLAENEILKSQGIGYAAILGSEAVQKGSIIAAAIIARNTVITASNNHNNIKIATTYRQKYPGTTLTNTEIVRLLEGKN